MGLFDRRKPKDKPARRDPGDREKAAGAREYEARHHERRAEQLERQGDDVGAKAERDTATNLRRPARGK